MDILTFKEKVDALPEEEKQEVLEIVTLRARAMEGSTWALAKLQEISGLVDNVAGVTDPE